MRAREVPLVLSIAIAAAGCSADLAEPDGATPDGGLALDAGAGEAGIPDGGSEDGGVEDAGAGDAGAEDAGSRDAGSGDGGADAGSDAGAPEDAGSQDAGVWDGGAPDAGADGGAPDAGPGCLSLGSSCVPATSNCCTGTTCEQLLSSSAYVCHETVDDGDGGRCSVEGQACTVTPCCTTCWQNFCCQSDGAPCNTGFECCSGWCEPTSHTCLTL